MEQIYLKNSGNINHPRFWHSDKTELGKYFKTYSKEVNKYVHQGRTFDINHVLKSVLPDSTYLNDEIINSLEKLSSIDQLKRIRKIPKTTNIKNLITKKSIPSGGRKRINELGIFKEKTKQSAKCGLKKELEGSNCSDAKKKAHLIGENGFIEDYSLDNIRNIHDAYIPGENGFIEDYNLGNIRNVHENECSSQNPARGNYQSGNTSDNFFLKEKQERGRTDLTAGKDFFVSFQVHEPFRRWEMSPASNYTQEIRVLGSQTLEVLRDKIICASDFQDIQGDLSDRPDTPVTFMTRDVYRSAMFYIDNTFYIDKRCMDYVDYSSVIRKWAIKRGIRLGPTTDMREVSVSELTLRFGYPYLYLHQGNCEHVIIVHDARLLCKQDSLHARDYPLMSSLHRPKAITCITCVAKRAKWIVSSNDRLLYDVTHMCDTCFKQFNYRDGKKHSDFKAYRFVDLGSLL